MNANSTDTLPKHLFVGVEGDLYRTDVSGWSKNPPLRSNYCRTHGEIETAADLKATLRAGPYAWPGGCPLYFVTQDGAALSFKSARDAFPQIAWSIKHGISDGWRVVATDVNYEDTSLVDAATGEPIESAYGKENE